MIQTKMIRLLGLFAALALIAAACSSPDDSLSSDTDSELEQDDDSSDGSDDEADNATPIEPDADVIDTGEVADDVADDVVSGTEAQAIAWAPCGNLECATIDVPADYRDLDGPTLSIAINRLQAADPAARQGVLFVNPGGPGAPGTDLAERFALGGFPTEVVESFDVIGFDPRGVGASEPSFACGASGEQLEVLSEVEDLTDEPDEIAAVEAAVQLCIDSIGDTAGLIHTGYVVRDMDEIRQALGEEQISYLGFSYGSTIGVWYATLFPDNVRAMVIDGADNPIDDLSDFEAQLESTREEITPIHDLLEQALEACDDSTCPIFNDGDPVSAYLEAAPLLELVNEASANNPSAGFLGLITPLYSESLWPQLYQGLADLTERNDPSIIAELAEFQLGPDPGAVNVTGFINCLDGWALQPEFDRQAQLQASADFFAISDQLDEEFPLLAPVEGDLASTCPFMDVLGTPPLDGPLDGGGVPILVVGNTSDPVTSFGESQELVEETLANGVLLEVDHASHTVYPANPCVVDAVHGVLIDVEFPTEAVVCERVSEAQSFLVEVCIQLAPQLDPSVDVSSLRDICLDFAEQSLDRLGEDTVLAGLDGSDGEASQSLLTILMESLVSAGG